ncbi:MAG: hypothetical protein RR314_03950 [Oscillospiraceae bacterium]
MKIQAIDEYNDEGHLIFADNYVGAFARGKTRQEAMQKLETEVRQYAQWRGIKLDKLPCTISLIQEKVSQLQICDADSDVIFDSELPPLTWDGYDRLKSVALKSASDFLAMYRSIPDKTGTTLTPRETFYGVTPTSADEMYEHCKNVNDYYFGEIKASATNEPNIYICRRKAFELLEEQSDFLDNRVFEGKGNEQWSLRKVCRRFIWHDRIHAKAMYKMAIKLCGASSVANPFGFISW